MHWNILRNWWFRKDFRPKRREVANLELAYIRSATDICVYMCSYIKADAGLYGHSIIQKTVTLYIPVLIQYIWFM